MTENIDQPPRIELPADDWQGWPEDGADGVAALVSLAAVGASTFLIMAAFGFINPVSGSFRAVAITSLVLAGVLAPVAYRFRNERGRVVLLRLFHNTLVAVWGGIVLAFVFMPTGSEFILAFLSLAILAGLLLSTLFFAGVRQAAASILAMVIIVAASWALLESDSWQVTWPAIGEAQVRLAEPHLRSDASTGRTKLVFGVHTWWWHRGLLDGGSGILYDPDHLVTSISFAENVWGELTTDPARCTHLYDDWYWCA